MDCLTEEDILNDVLLTEKNMSNAFYIKSTIFIVLRLILLSFLHI